MAEGEPKLTGAEVGEFRRMLLERRRTLEEQLGFLNEEAAEEFAPEQAEGRPKTPTHPADVATDEQDRVMTGMLIARQRHEIIEIDEALRRIEDGTYGLCQADGHGISRKRLKANPAARFCVEHDRGQSSIASGAEPETPPHSF